MAYPQLLNQLRTDGHLRSSQPGPSQPTGPRTFGSHVENQCLGADWLRCFKLEILGGASPLGQREEEEQGRISDLNNRGGRQPPCGHHGLAECARAQESPCQGLNPSSASSRQVSQGRAAYIPKMPKAPADERREELLPCPLIRALKGMFL